MMKHYLYWLMLSFLNALVGLVLGTILLNNEPELSFTVTLLMMILGIMFIAFLYAKLDRYLISTDKMQWRNALKTAVMLKATMQFFPYIDVAIGGFMFLLLDSLGSGGISSTGFVHVFVFTVMHGFLASIIVACLTCILYFLHNKSITQHTRYK